MSRGEFYGRRTIVSIAGIALVLGSCTETHVSAKPNSITTPTVSVPSLPGQSSVSCLTLAERAGVDGTIDANPIPGLTKAYYSTRQVSGSTVLVDQEVNSSGKVIAHKDLPISTELIPEDSKISPEYIFKDPSDKADVGVFIRRVESPDGVVVNFVACPSEAQNNVTT